MSRACEGTEVNVPSFLAAGSSRHTWLAVHRISEPAAIS